MINRGIINACRIGLCMLGLVLFSGSAFCQYTLSGTVKDKSDGNLLAGASVTLGNVFSTITDDRGTYRFENLKEGTYVLLISYTGFAVFNQEVRIAGNTSVNADLNRNTMLSEVVLVTATRASENSATTFTHFGKQQVEEKNFGQDLPYILQYTPSVVVTSDAGTGIGYTGIRIRGTDATRINLTINGIPLNDAESQGTFLVNLPDFASSIDNIQIQRGVGTSTNGAGTFGGSINVQTTTLSESPYAELNTSAGSFGTLKNTLRAGSGLINTKFSLDTRLSRIVSDGFIDRGASDLKSFFVSGAYHGKTSLLRLNAFSGIEKTYQAWNGVPEAKLHGDQNALLTHYYNNLGYLYFTAEDSLNLFNPSNNRTFNGFLYDNQTDNYQQDHYQALYSKQLSSAFYINTALHYTKGRGYYEEFKYAQSLNNYKLDTVFTGSDTITETDLIRKKWLDNDFYGLTWSMQYISAKKIGLTFGGAYNEYDGMHFGEVIWAQYASTGPIRHRYYENDAYKTDFNIFGKADYALDPDLSLFTDLQYRTVNYSFLGYDQDLNNVKQGDKLTFFNPKAGVAYALSPGQRFYASYSIAHKEPNRDDYTQSSPQSRPRPEELRDWELGYRNSAQRFAFGLTYYYMQYKDQLILTGEINNVGAYVRTNIPESYRTGVELEGSLHYGKFRWNANTTLSMNKVLNFTEYTDVFTDTSYTQLPTSYGESDIAFSPSVIAGNQLNYTLWENLEISLLSKYVGKQYLDNTSNEARKIDAYLLNDVRASWRFGKKAFRHAEVSFMVNNLLDEEYESGGYTYGYIYSGQAVRENFYYPQAGRHYTMRLNLGF